MIERWLLVQFESRGVGACGMQVLVVSQALSHFRLSCMLDVTAVVSLTL